MVAGGQQVRLDPLSPVGTLVPLAQSDSSLNPVQITLWARQTCRTDWGHAFFAGENSDGQARRTLSAWEQPQLWNFKARR